MSTDVIGSRYRLTEVVARTGEATTRAAHDTWLDQPVMLVTPEPGATVRFEETAASLQEHVSPYLVALYDAGPPPATFVVLETPSATWFDELPTRDEEDVLMAGRSLGDALDALHRRGIVHGAIQPGTAVRAGDGQMALSPWPLKPRPSGWNGTEDFPGDPPGRNGDARAAARRRSRFDSLEQAYMNYRSKPPLNQLHPDALRAYVDGGFVSSPDGSVTLRCGPATEAEVFRHAATSGAWSAVPALEIPVAVVAGRPDVVGPAAFAPAIADALPEGTFIERPQFGHFGPLQDPAAMAEDVFSWIRSHS